MNRIFQALGLPNRAIVGDTVEGHFELMMLEIISRLPKKEVPRDEAV
jgi:hypothetical protein